MIVAAADHGVVAQEVTGYPQAVTAQMVRNFLTAPRSAPWRACSACGRIVADAGIAADGMARWVRGGTRPRLSVFGL